MVVDFVVHKLSATVIHAIRTRYQHTLHCIASFLNSVKLKPRWRKFSLFWKVQYSTLRQSQIFSKFSPGKTSRRIISFDRCKVCNIIKCEWRTKQNILYFIVYDQFWWTYWSWSPSRETWGNVTTGSFSHINFGSSYLMNDLWNTLENILHVRFYVRLVARKVIRHIFT